MHFVHRYKERDIYISETTGKERGGRMGEESKRGRITILMILIFFFFNHQAICLVSNFQTNVRKVLLVVR